MPGPPIPPRLAQTALVPASCRGSRATLCRGFRATLCTSPSTPAGDRRLACAQSAGAPPTLYTAQPDPLEGSGWPVHKGAGLRRLVHAVVGLGGVSWSGRKVGVACPSAQGSEVVLSRGYGRRHPAQARTDALVPDRRTYGLASRAAYGPASRAAHLCLRSERSRATDVAGEPTLCTDQPISVVGTGWLARQRHGIAPTLMGQPDPTPGAAGWCTKAAGADRLVMRRSRS